MNHFLNIYNCSDQMQARKSEVKFRSPRSSLQDYQSNTTNPPPILLISTDSYFYFSNQLVARIPMREPSFLKINRETAKMTILDEQHFSNEITYTQQKKTKDYWQLFCGVLIVNQEPYLCGAARTQAVATLDNEIVYNIKQFKFIPFKHSCLYLVINQSQNSKILEYINDDIIKNNFYFCYGRDLTLTSQKIYQKRMTERKYFWNENMLVMFRGEQIPKCWKVPIVQGHVRELFSKTKNFTFYYCLISRRSKFMSGTRYNSRGIDDNFNAANFVQTEEIFICQNFLFTHVAVRGSVPIFWEQEGFGAAATFTHTDEQNMHVLEKHFQLLKKQYQSYVIAINLLSLKKESERDLTNRYKHYLYKTIPSEPYIHYDLNQQIKNKEKTMNEVIDRFISEHLDKFAPNQNFFCVDRETGKLYSQQSILPRINCLDCLDRSNVIMSRLSLIFIQQVEIFISCYQDSHTNMVEKKIDLTRDYKEEVIKLWADLGNRISLIYSGTESTATHLTKQQQSSFFSFLSQTFNSANRYFQSNLKDDFKQTCLDFLLGQKQQLSKTTYFEDNIMTKIIKQHEYCDYDELVVYAITWNCNMVDPSKLAPRDLDKLFNFPIEKTDIIVVCLQEMVELNGFNVVFGSNQSTVEDWQKVVMKYLNQQGQQCGRSFAMLASYNMVGIATFVFTCGKIYNRVGKTMWHEVKTGFNNSLGNKGAILLFLQIDDSFITFINCHLAAGEKESALRMQGIDYIHNQALNERFKRRLFDKSEFKFFIGDLNFRLQAKNEEVRQLLYTIEKQDTQKKLTKSEMQTMLSILLQKDEYRLNKTYRSLSMYNEATIYFMPTYKYIKKEKKYDLKRTPSWCDRILFSCTEPQKLAVLKYWDIDCYHSDHKPVCGAFKVLIKTEDKDKKRKLMQKYMEKEM